jgi:hypothetical protein
MEGEVAFIVYREFNERYGVVVPRLELAMRAGAESFKQAPNQRRLPRVVLAHQQILVGVELHVTSFLLAVRE